MKIHLLIAWFPCLLFILLWAEQCLVFGVPGHQASLAKITGSEKVDMKQHTSFVILFPSIPLGTGGFDFVGSGNLVSDSWILTTAAVVYDYQTAYSLTAFGYAFTDFITKTRIHPGFNMGNYDNNIALLKLLHKVGGIPHLTPLCFSSTVPNLDGQSATVLGFGSDRLGEPASGVLRKVILPIIWPDKCQQYYSSKGNKTDYQPPFTYNYLTVITRGLICAGSPLSGIDVCLGDQGGPMLLNCTEGGYVLIGLVSHNLGCGVSRHPSIFTNVNSYMHWIQLTTNYEICMKFCTTPKPNTTAHVLATNTTRRRGLFRRNHFLNNDWPKAPEPPVW